MKKGNLLVLLAATLLFMIGTIMFTLINIDHSECEVILKNSIGPNGDKISTEEHLCREIFNL